MAENRHKRMEAISSLAPSVGFRYDDTGITNWYSSSVTQPTEAEIDAEVIRLQAVFDSQEYARNRKVEYPTIEECVHAILDDDLTALQVKRQAVKDKYPKE